VHRIKTFRSSKDQPVQSLPPEICELCFSDLVQPVNAETHAAGTVRLTLRCPECHNVRTGECSWEEARAFGRHFARGKAALRVTYDELADENFRDELDCLVLALHTDLIGPDDFAPFRYSA
jgi:hypothetical protein